MTTAKNGCHIYMKEPVCLRCANMNDTGDQDIVIRPKLDNLSGSGVIMMV